MRVYVCHGPYCAPRVRPVWQALVLAAQRHGVAEQCELIVSGCQGRCEYGPNVNVYPNLTRYAALTPDDATRIVGEHIAEGRPVVELAFRPDD